MRRTLALALLAALAACHTRYTGVSGALKLGTTAEDNYERGMAELKDKNYPEATRFFEYVKTKYPFSNVSALSDLRISDIKFAQSRYVEAADGYEKFSKDHPSSDQVEYALYRAGLSHARAAPAEFLLFPPAWEKDQRETEKAVTVLRDFVAKYPTSTYLSDAKKTLAQAEEVLARREMYVGDFYYKREEWAGAAGRYKGLFENYPSTSLADPAQLKLAQAYVRMNAKFQARQTLQRFITQHPDSGERRQAEKLLESLR
ncbi:MAG TPA: outer membrane protein assembly factor BamD [Anaeromyxobacter sp.]|nr:outer membrane protein assembly factor BamD [Anaeromyxobacter sp.]